MTERIPDAEPLHRHVPDSLLPKENGPRFPTLTRSDLIELAQAGWERIGVIVLVVNPAGEILTVTHGEGNPKVVSGTMGVISETLTYDADGVEQIEDGISRLFAEELGLSDEEIRGLHLHALDHGAAQPVKFPLSAGRDALGLVIVLRADEHTADTMIKRDSGFNPTREIRYAGFTRPEPLASNAPLASIFRKGTPSIFQAAMETLTSPRAHSQIVLPAPRHKSANSLEDLKDLLSP